jgi:hypothetical protein
MVRKLFRYVFGHCSYCGNLLRNGGGRGYGTPHRVLTGEPGTQSHEVTQYACMNCEMTFDDD